MKYTAWGDSVEKLSPDGTMSAKVSVNGEVCQGGPTIGLFELSNGMKIESCNPSFVWSDCSNFVAVPQWRKKFLATVERILVIDVVERTAIASTKTFDVVELKKFSGHLISGLDSPLRNSKEFTLDLNDPSDKFETL